MTQSSHVTNDLAPCGGPARTGAAGRQGVLLLVVLSMLTLFMMLGVAYLLAATRAKEAARAFSRLGLSAEARGVSPQRALEDVLLTVIRDRAATGDRPKELGTPSTTFKFESLLSDRYGHALASVAGDSKRIEGEVDGVTVSGPLISATFKNPVGTMPANVASLNGRILTFLPASGRPTSHRIIRAVASGGNSTLWLAPSLMPVPFKKPAAGTEVVINGREFSAAPAATPITDTDNENESWDGFGDNNVANAHDLWLAHLEPMPMSVSTATCKRPSYFSAMPSSTDLDGDGISDRCDNDGDGIDDGVFLDFGFPATINSAGESVRTHASVLIVDLDGRFNVNAHDSMTHYLYSETHDGWTTEIPNLADIPLGNGYGPAEVRANLGVTVVDEKMQPISTPTATHPRILDGSSLATGENPRLFMMAGGRMSNQVGARIAGSRFTMGTATPDLPALEGKYGEKAPGNWNAPVNSIQLNEWAGNHRFARPGTANDTRRWSDKSQILDSGETHQDRRVPYGTAITENLGIPAVWWDQSESFDWSEIVEDASRPRQIFNSPPDLHGRMKSTTLPASGNDTVPHLVFAKPEWFTGSDGRRFTEVSDDPYEIHVDTFVSRGGRLHDPATDGTADPEYDLGLPIKSRDNPFTLAELEAVLRPYDIDTRLAPHRLAAILGSAAEEMRVRVTTDSWDTTAIVGGGAAGEPEAAKRLDTFVNALATADTYGSTSMGGHTRPISGGISHEISRGERFDLNRPLVGAESKPATYDATDDYYVQRQAYCKDLYTLLVALDPSATKAELAQWAVNACDFRDGDSVMTPFEYDTNPANGWDVDGNISTDEGADREVAWGAERPEILISEVFAWENDSGGEVFILLHRPWKATAYAHGTTAIDAEPCDTLLESLSASKPINEVDLGRKSNNTASVTSADYPIWRLKIVAPGLPPKYVRFDQAEPAMGTSDQFTSSSVDDPSKTPRLGSNSWLCVRGNNSIPVAVSDLITEINIDRGGPFRVPGTAGQDLRQATIFLERLTDPTADASNCWATTPSDAAPVYRVVDKADVRVVYSGAGAGNTKAGVGNLGNDKPVGNASGTGGQLYEPKKTQRVVDAVNTAFWKIYHPLVPAASPMTGIEIKPLTPGNPPGNPQWFPWANRPFVSAVELLLVPRGDAVSMLRDYQSPSASNQDTVGVPIDLSLLFDAVHVPTRFIGIHSTYRGPPAAAGADPSYAELEYVDPTYETNTGINTLITTINQLSSFREPGRVNINTIPSDDIWNAVVGGPLAEGLLAAGGQNKNRSSVNFTTTPARTLCQALSLSTAADPVPREDDYAGGPATLQDALARNPMHRFYTANRLANTVTIRSNIFAVWITLRTSVENDPDSVRYHRAFAIIDRSIPVGFLPGKDLNARDTVRLWRVIE